MPSNACLPIFFKKKEKKGKMCAIFWVCASLNLLGDYRQISVILIFLSSDVFCCCWNRNIWVPLFLFMPSRVGYQSLPASRFIWRARRATQLAYQNDLFKDNIQQTFILVEMMVQRTPWYFVYFTLKFWFILLLNLQSSGIKKKKSRQHVNAKNAVTLIAT